MEDPKPPNTNYNFSDYRKEVIGFIKQTDRTFGFDAGKVGMILESPSKYFSVLKKLKEYIYAKVDNKNLSIENTSMLKELRRCLEFRLKSLNCKILPLQF